MLLTHLARLTIVGGIILAPTDTVIDRTIPVHAGEKLKVTLATGGVIHVTGWSESSVSVNATLRASACPDGTMSVTNDRGTVLVASTRVKNSQKACAVPDVVDVKVPEHFDIAIESNGGGVTINGVSGTIEGRTGAGSLKLTHVGGRVKLDTESGDVDMEDSHVNGSLHTASGHVTFIAVTGAVHGTSDSEGTNIAGAS